MMAYIDEAIEEGGPEPVVVARVSMASALHGRGIVYRVDAPESGPISACDVSLTDAAKKWLHEHVDTPQEKPSQAGEDNNSEQGRLLTGNAALRFMANLTENQRGTLRDMRDGGGSIEADPLDGELQSPLRMGLVEMPSMAYPGIPCTWTLPVNVNMILNQHPEVLDGRVDGLDCNRQAPSR